MLEFFQTFLYQPFLNLLVGLYWLLEQIPGINPDMGIAVIIFTVFVRIILLPVSFASHRSEKERKEIEEQIKEVKSHYRDNPVMQQQSTKKVFRRNRRIVIAELVSLSIQVAISLILWRIFADGLQGADQHLVYSWMPDIFPIPDEKLMFMGFSLWEPHWQMNLLQSFLIFILETLSVYVSPYPVSRGEVVRLQLVLPFVSFLIFSQLPAGKKLFVITTILFSIGLTLIRAIIKKAKEIEARLHKQDELLLAPEQEQKVVVDVK